MSLQIDSETGTEPFLDQVTDAVRGALGERVESGTWKLTLRKLPLRLGLLVDLNNQNGLARQWVFDDPSEPIAAIISRDLKGTL